LDLEAVNFGFFAKVALPVLGGGVTAGSMVSVPRDFFVNEVVAMISTFAVSKLELQGGLATSRFLRSHQNSSYSFGIS